MNARAIPGSGAGPSRKPLHKASDADILIVQAGLATPGWRCEHCRNFGSGTVASCPVCGKEPLPVDAIEELVELALDMRSQVEFQPADCGIRELGGVAAILKLTS